MQLGKLAIWTSVEGLELGPAIETAQRIESLGYSALWHPMAMRRDLFVIAATLLDPGVYFAINSPRASSTARPATATNATAPAAPAPASGAASAPPPAQSNFGPSPGPETKPRP